MRWICFCFILAFCFSCRSKQAKQLPPKQQVSQNTKDSKKISNSKESKEKLKQKDKKQNNKALAKANVQKKSILKLYHIGDMIPEEFSWGCYLIPEKKQKKKPFEEKTQEEKRNELVKAIKNTIAKSTWDKDPSYIGSRREMIIIRHTEEVHSQVKAFLQKERINILGIKRVRSLLKDTKRRMVRNSKKAASSFIPKISWFFP